MAAAAGYVLQHRQPIIKFHFAPARWQAELENRSPGVPPDHGSRHRRGMMIMSHIGDPIRGTTANTRRCHQVRPARGSLRAWKACSNDTKTTSGSAPTWAATRKTLADCNRCWIGSPSCTGLQRHAMDGPRDHQHRDASRDFFIRNQDRILFGSDQVSGDDRNYDFYASASGASQAMETANAVPRHPGPRSAADRQPVLRGWRCPMLFCKSSTTTTPSADGRRWRFHRSLIFN